MNRQSIAEGVGLLNYTLQPELRKLCTLQQNVAVIATDASVYNRLKRYYDWTSTMGGILLRIKHLGNVRTIYSGISSKCDNIEKYLNKMIWVKGHNGNKWNEYTDDSQSD